MIRGVKKALLLRQPMTLYILDVARYSPCPECVEINAVINDAKSSDELHQTWVKTLCFLERRR